MPYARFGWNWPCSTEVENFQIFSIYFYHYAIISFEEGCGPLFVKIWIPSNQGCFVLNLVEIGSVVLKREFLNIFNIILLFRFYLPFEKGLVLHLNKLKSPPSKDALRQDWLKLDQWFWRRRFLNFLPFEKDGALHNLVTL